MSKRLTDKQEMFCKEYIACDLNATQAAINTGYAKKTANREGSRLLSNVDIQNRITELKADRVERLEIDADDLVRQLEMFRNASISEYAELITEEKTVVTKDGLVTLPAIQQIKWKDFKDLTEDQLKCIESVKQGTNGIELKLHGKEWTIEKLSRHIGFYEKDNNQGGKAIVQVYKLDDDTSITFGG